MKQLRKTEWRRGYPIKKNLALCAWGMLALEASPGYWRARRIFRRWQRVFLHWRAQS